MKNQYKKGIIFASDKRLLYAGKYLIEKQIDVEIILNKDMFINRPIADAFLYNFVILPVCGTKDGTITLENECISINEFLQNLNKDCIVISGITTQYETSLSCQYLNFQMENTLSLMNARYTAEGVLYMIMKDTPKSIFDYTYDVVGIGKCGNAICDLLEKLKLTTRKIEAKVQKGMISIEEWNKLEPSDIVINTAPQLAITKCIAEQWIKKEIILIDISSSGKGVEDSVKKLSNVQYIMAPPLPGIVTPESAGKLIAELIMSKIYALCLQTNEDITPEIFTEKTFETEKYLIDNRKG